MSRPAIGPPIRPTPIKPRCWDMVAFLSLSARGGAIASSFPPPAGGGGQGGGSRRAPDGAGWACHKQPPPYPPPHAGEGKRDPRRLRTPHSSARTIFAPSTIA